MTKTFGLIKKHNKPSIKAHMYRNENTFGTINGVVRRVTFFGGLFEHVTPGSYVFSKLEEPMSSKYREEFEQLMAPIDARNTSARTDAANE